MTAKNAKTTRRTGANDAWLRIVMAAIGACAVVLMLGVFVLETVRSGSATPDVTLSVAGIERAGDGWIVRVRAHNSGKATAAQLTIEGRLVNGETSALTLDYLPDGSSRSGGLVFRSRPAEENLSLRVTGYRDP